jgi:hypothetical protein
MKPVGGKDAQISGAYRISPPAFMNGSTIVFIE